MLIEPSSLGPVQPHVGPIIPVICALRVLVNIVPLLNCFISICLLQCSLRIYEPKWIIHCAICICNAEWVARTFDRLGCFGCFLGPVQPHVSPIIPVIRALWVLVNTIPLLNCSISICLLQCSLRVCERIRILKCCIWISAQRRNLIDVLLGRILNHLK